VKSHSSIAGWIFGKRTMQRKRMKTMARGCHGRLKKDENKKLEENS
jgi:hypothetical protein